VLRSLTLGSRSVGTTVGGIAASGCPDRSRDSFNDRTDEGWTPYDPMGPTSAAEWSATFPQVGTGDFAYRLVGKAGTNTLGLFQRGGSIRGEQYSDFSVAADIINHDERLYGNAWFPWGTTDNSRRRYDQRLHCRRHPWRTS
jgi:hypothetical protein